MIVSASMVFASNIEKISILDVKVKECEERTMSMIESNAKILEKIESIEDISKSNRDNIQLLTEHLLDK